MLYSEIMFTTRPELSGTFGAVASTHWLASASGMAMLEAGGVIRAAANPRLMQGYAVGR